MGLFGEVFFQRFFARYGIRLVFNVGDWAGYAVMIRYLTCVRRETERIKFDFKYTVVRKKCAGIQIRKIDRGIISPGKMQACSTE